MEERKIIGRVVNEEYLRIVPRMAYYLKGKNIAGICIYKCPTFAAAGEEGRIKLFSNSLENMCYLCGHKTNIHCLCLWGKIFASGSGDNDIKIWEIEGREIMATLSGHTDIVCALCYVREGVFVSGSKDKSLVIWSKSPPESTIYSLRQRLRGHTSYIQGIIRMNKREIVSGEYANGDLRIWDLDQGLCIRHILMGHTPLSQMKHIYMGEVALGTGRKVNAWGAANNWGDPLRQFNVCPGYSIEFLSGDILLRGGRKGELEFIDYAQTGCQLPSTYRILGIQPIAKNMVITVSYERDIKGN